MRRLRGSELCGTAQGASLTWSTLVLAVVRVLSFIFRWCVQQPLPGAIMFNDPLTPTQCERLVNQLADTAFPFQCAHGRPALAPLARLGDVASRRQLRGGRIDWSRLANVDK